MTSKLTGIGANGIRYYIDPITKKCKKVETDLASVIPDFVDDEVTPLTTYQRYLKDKLGGDAPIKKGKLHFREYRIYFDQENGFCIDDIRNRYKLVETGFEDIPSPKELGEWFEQPERTHTAKDMAKAKKLGDKLAKERAEKYDEVIEILEEEEIDYEELRRKVLLKIQQIEQGIDTTFDPLEFPNMIPFKKWKRKVNAIVKLWKNKKIRYKKFLRQIKEATEEQSFEEVTKKHRTSYVGELLPEFKNVERLEGNKMVVDGKKIDAVPFMLRYLLHYEPKAMQQLMRYAEGEVDATTLLTKPFHDDWKIEYKSKAIKNTEENARLLSALCSSCEIVSPEDLVYVGLDVGDKILIQREGEWVKDVVTKTEEGIELQNEIGLAKTDKWIKLNNEEEK